MAKQPMSLEDLPGHLQQMRERGETGSAPVVGMGTLEEPKKSSNWTAILLALMLVFTVGLGGYTTYNVMTPSELTVMVEGQNMSPQAIAIMVEESGGEVIAVKQNEDSTYEVKVSTHSRKGKFLDRLRQRLRIKKSSVDE